MARLGQRGEILHVRPESLADGGEARGNVGQVSGRDAFRQRVEPLGCVADGLAVPRDVFLVIAKQEVLLGAARVKQRDRRFVGEPADGAGGLGGPAVLVLGRLAGEIDRRDRDEAENAERTERADLVADAANGE